MHTLVLKIGEFRENRCRGDSTFVNGVFRVTTWRFESGGAPSCTCLCTASRRSLFAVSLLCKLTDLPAACPKYPHRTSKYRQLTVLSGYTRCAVQFAFCSRRVLTKSDFLVTIDQQSAVYLSQFLLLRFLINLAVLCQLHTASVDK